MKNDPRNLMPGDRVLVFDYRLFRDDTHTPLSFTMRPATIVKRYGSLSTRYSKDYQSGMLCYPDLVDVQFDHRSEISRGHFTDAVETIKENK